MATRPCNLQVDKTLLSSPAFNLPTTNLKKNAFLEVAQNYIFQHCGEKMLIEKTLQTVLKDFSESQKMEMQVLMSYENEKKALKVFKFYVSEKIVAVVYVFLKK